MFSYEEAKQMLQEGFRMKNTARADTVIFIDGKVMVVDGILQTMPTLMGLSGGLNAELTLTDKDTKANWEIVATNR
ncbi:TPA: hypothetical protein KNH08_002010 [Serratia fonticola]|nr:hypothetical protein [Serratia fonticola]